MASRSSAPKSGSRRGRRAAAPEPGPMPDVVYAQASPRSVGGLSLFEAAVPVTKEVAVDYASEAPVVRNAVVRLRQAGFEVLQVAPTTVNIAGPASLYEQVFATRLVTEERPVLKEQGREDTATFVECPETDLPGLIDVSNSQLADVLEGVAIEEPRYPDEHAFAPAKQYWHLRVPGDVSLGVDADRAHRSGVTGRGVKVVMCDSGWYRHPYFTQRGYRTSPTVLGPGAANPEHDEVGHGTAESANVFAVAPDVDFTMVKMSFVNSIGGFNAAVTLAPHIISCSWSSDIQNPPLSAADQALAAAVATAVAGGIVVVFSTGNGRFGFPGQHPDVISAGGVFLHQDGKMEASDYASGFASKVYPPRNVPDVCGLVGMRPRAAYIMLPLEAGGEIDKDLASGDHPDGDETPADDGWSAISGTSAAAPQLAGVCALIKQVCGTLTPAEVRDILQTTARDVTAGKCSPRTGGHAARPGADLATGSGLVNAHRAVLVAKVRCLGPAPPPPLVPPSPLALPQPASAPPPGPPPPVAPAGTAEAAGPQWLSAEDVAALEEYVRETDHDPGL
jgi:Subtilase family